MIYLERPGPPAHLMESGVAQKWHLEILQWAKKAVENQHELPPKIKLPFQERDFGLELEKFARRAFAQKCVYCETVQQGENSNFRLFYYRPFPNEVGLKNRQKALHYLWLSWQWPNMYLACPSCYNQYLNNARPFPIKNQLAHPAMCKSYEELFQITWLNETEQPLILDPCYDNPVDHIQYALKEDCVDLKGLSDRGEITISVLHLNREVLRHARRREADHFEEQIHTIEQLALNGVLKQENIDSILSACAPGASFAGLKRYILQQWLDKHQQEANDNKLQDQLRKWQIETAVPPQPYPPPSNQTTGPPPPPLPSPQEYPIVRWKVTGIKKTEKKHYIRLLKSLCQSLKEVTVKHEFGAGFSGAKVFLVTRKNMNGELLSPIVVKFDKLNSLQEEVENYNDHIDQKFEKCVSLENGIHKLPQIPFACIAYQLAGGGKFEVESLKTYWRHYKHIEDVLRPLKTLVADWKGAWIEGKTKRDFSLLSYDWLLPPNFIIEVETNSNVSDAINIDSNDIFEFVNSSNYLGATVCIQPASPESKSFIVSEVDEDTNEMTLDLPAENEPDKFRIRLHNLENINQFKRGQALSSPVYGRIKNDRITFLKQIVARAFNNQLVGLNEDQVILPGLNNLPLENPLHQLPRILNTDLSSAKVTTVHGDMNLENILIRTDSLGHDISVIDFGKTRKAQNIHDLLRLEANVWLYLIAWMLPHLAANDEPVLAKQVRKIVSFFRSVHDLDVAFVSNDEIDLSIPYAILCQIRKQAFEIMDGAQEQLYKNYYLGLCLYMLGALKFKNLDLTENNAPLPKQIAFQVACLAYHSINKGWLEPESDDDGPDPPHEAAPEQQRIPVLSEEQPEIGFLHEEIDKAFNQDELIELCFKIGVDYENLSGENKQRKGVELVKYCIRHEILATLIEYCKRERPFRDWDNLQMR